MRIVIGKRPRFFIALSISFILIGSLGYDLGHASPSSSAPAYGGALQGTMPCSFYIFNDTATKTIAAQNCDTHQLVYGGSGNAGGAAGNNFSAVSEAALTGLGNVGGTIVYAAGNYTATHQTIWRVTSTLPQGLAVICDQSGTNFRTSSGCFFNDIEAQANRFAFVFSFANGVTAGLRLDGLSFQGKNVNGTQIIAPVTSGNVRLNIGSISSVTQGSVYGTAFDISGPDEPPDTMVGTAQSIYANVGHALTTYSIHMVGTNNLYIGLLHGGCACSLPSIYIHNGQDITIAKAEAQDGTKQTGPMLELNQVTDFNLLSCDLENTAGSFIKVDATSPASLNGYIQCSHLGTPSTITTGVDLGTAVNFRVYASNVNAHAGSGTAFLTSNCNGCYVQENDNPVGFSKSCDSNAEQFFTVDRIGAINSAPAPVTPGASPWTFQLGLCLPQIITVNDAGGTISQVQLAFRVNGVLSTTTLFSGASLTTFTWPKLEPSAKLIFTYTGTLAVNETATF